MPASMFYSTMARSIPRFPASELRSALRRAVYYEPRDSIAVEGQEQWACLGLPVSSPQSSGGSLLQLCP
jgi:hypothetical protein